MARWSRCWRICAGCGRWRCTRCSLPWPWAAMCRWRPNWAIWSSYKRAWRPGRRYNMSDTEFRIDPATRPGHVHLIVANLENELVFYQKVIGLQVHWREGASAGLGAGGDDLLRLTENKGARRYRGTTGIYHFAILL